MKLAVVGSRDFSNYQLMEQVLSQWTDGGHIEEIISGGASGADSLARDYAKEHNIPLIEFLPNWKLYGKSAGPLRNKDIVDRADEVVAFWNGVSAGTKSTIDLAKKSGKPCKIIKYYRN